MNLFIIYAVFVIILYMYLLEKCTILDVEVQNIFCLKNSDLTAHFSKH